nr:hypothetical protein [uncultured Acetatifactor sp.]
MTAKEYLSQAYHLDQRIRCKMEQVASLDDLAKRAVAIISDTPGNPNRGRSAMADAVEKIVDLKMEIKAEIGRLVDLKVGITNAISQVGNEEYQVLLEKRYLCFQTWEDISVELGWSLRWTYAIHGKALAELDEKMNSAC